MENKRDKIEIIKRYIFLAIGLLINAFGVVLITKSSLGVAPIAAVPFVLSSHFALSFGTFTFLFYLLLFLVQALILRKNLHARDLIQIPLSLVYSVFIDICVSLASGINPDNYAAMMIILVIGCVFRALGVAMQVIADEAMLSGEAFMITIAKAIHREFSLVKLWSDATFVLTGIVLSLLFIGKIVGIREGTLIGVIFIAPMTRLFTPALTKIENRMLISNQPIAFKRLYKQGDSELIITISSQSGSGGHKIARILSKKLGMPLYDNNLIKMISEEGGFPEGYVREHMERLYTNRFWEFYVENYTYTGYSLESYKPLFDKQAKVVEEIAQRGSAIIVGYCSEYLLRDRKNVISIYIHADEETKLQFLKQEYNVNLLEARKIMRSHDRERALYFKHFTGEEWAIGDRFSLSIDSSLLGIEGTADLLYDIIERMKES